ncbi:expressed unknown protein [Seminavis robusta]|uniref:Uncharacterized protein n=1 Tax=Seminavis robusta TaxID=568900 RepID=A0A9N8EHQ7_9STRA|nr:expressed unknown protein [Seminavis robusta]|eukprot:Sro1119_g243200.1 n/a (547) ;mRNA; r:18062-19830
MSMRNRTQQQFPNKIRSPIQRTSSRDKGIHGAGSGGGFTVKAAMAVVGLGLLGLFLYMGNNGSSNQAVDAATSNPNSVRKVLQEQPADQEKKPQDGGSGSGKSGAIEQQMRDQLKAEARKAAQEHHERDQANLQQAHDKALQQKGVKGVETNKNKNVEHDKNGKLIVRDAEGDIVQDDMLAKDIAAGRDVEGPKEVEQEETDVAVGDNRWKDSKNIPNWLKEYFEWHVEVTSQLVKPNWREQKYLVMTCLGGEICGNVAHRLRPMMAMLRIAADSKRIFYIHWDLPDRLEKFLHPPQHGGIDWVVPDFVMWKVRKSPHQNDIEIIVQQAYQDDRRVVNVMYNDDTFAEPYYNDRRKDEEKAASEAFKDVWNVLFKPSFMLTERMTESLRLMGLEPGEYATAHIDYEMVPKDDAEQEDLRLKVENAMNCMSHLRPGGPFLVAAQTYAIAREAIVYGKQHNVKVHAKQIAHDTSTVPTDLFTSFVEIMLMANSRCVAYNRGGYGQLGYMLGYNYNCRIKYTEGEGAECKWTDPLPATEEREKIAQDAK